MNNRFNINEEISRTKELMGILNEREITFTQDESGEKKYEEGIHMIEHSEDIINVKNHYDGKTSSNDYPIIPGEGIIKFKYSQKTYYENISDEEMVSNVKIIKTIKKTPLPYQQEKTTYEHTVTLERERNTTGKSVGNKILLDIIVGGLKSGSHKVIMPLENYWVSFTVR